MHPNERPMATTPASTPVLHRFLGIGLVLVAAAFLVLRYLGIAPLLPIDRFTIEIAYGSSGLAVVLAAVALFVFKPRVPNRVPGQSVQEYWSTPEVCAKVIPVWFLLEGAGMMAAAGYLLAGEHVSAITMALAIGAFWLCGPSEFAKA